MSANIPGAGSVVGIGSRGRNYGRKKNRLLLELHMAFDDEVAAKSLSIASTSNHDLDHDDCSVDLDDSDTASRADLEQIYLLARALTPVALS